MTNNNVETYHTTLMKINNVSLMRLSFYSYHTTLMKINNVSLMRLSFYSYFSIQKNIYVSLQQNYNIFVR